MGNYDQYVTFPMFGYEDKHHYYRDISSRDQLHKIPVPCLFVHSWDDFALGPDSMPHEEFAKCDNLMLMTSKAGGHCTYFAHGRLFGLLPTGWYREPLSTYLKFISEEIK